MNDEMVTYNVSVQAEMAEEITKVIGPNWLLRERTTSKFTNQESPREYSLVVPRTAQEQANLRDEYAQDPEVNRPEEFFLYKQIAAFCLTKLPGCCGVCVSHGASVRTDYRGKGLGTLLQKFRIAKAKELGYTILLATDKSNNAPSQKIMRKHNWIPVTEFRNARTGNLVTMHFINLRTKPALAYILGVPNGQ